MYVMLECYGSPFEDATDLGEIPEFDGVESWMSGELLDGVPEPIRIELDADNPGVLLEMFKSDVLVMSARLVEALQGAGVDNLQVYDLELVDPATGDVHRSHKMVNVVGKVSCAEGGSGDEFLLEGASIDPDRAHGLLLFRLAESLSAIVIHESVRDHLIENGFDMLTFTQPEEWVG